MLLEARIIGPPLTGPTNTEETREMRGGDVLVEPSEKEFWWAHDDDAVPSSPYFVEESEQQMGWDPVDSILNSPTPPSPTLLERCYCLTLRPNPRAALTRRLYWQ